VNRCQEAWLRAQRTASWPVCSHPAVDADTSLEVLARFAALGGRNAVLLASGFESSSGKARMQRLTDLADAHLLNVVGPNSQGLWSVPHRMILAFGSEAQRVSPRAGPAAVLAASGSLGGAVTRQLLDHGVGVSYFVSMGDGAVLDTADYLEHVCRDPAVRVIALYLEGAPAAGPPPLVLRKSDDLRTWPGIGRLARALSARLPSTCVLETRQSVTFPLPGPPWVVKPTPNVVAHKTDRGLVHLHLHTVDQVTAAVSKVREAVGPSAPVLIQQTVIGVEVLAAVGRDSEWGTVLTLGTGGSLVELLDEVIHLTVPASEQEVRDAISRLPISRLLAGHRGIAPSDVDALVRIVMRLQDMVVANADRIDEIELNPLVVGPVGEGAFMVDVLVKEQESRAG
jgi:acyl-CoA synthetase (NDP forming)